jgi:hypothetical protein
MSSDLKKPRPARAKNKLAQTNSKHDHLIDPNWRASFSTLEEFYRHNYPEKYFDFERGELRIDPMETKEDIEAYDSARRELEIKRCAVSFHYFCHKYVKITHPKAGLLPFITYKYQRRCIGDYEKNRFNIISKFRQGGLTTVTVLWAMWRCLFKLDETIMVVSKTDREAIAAGEIVKRALEELPHWMSPIMSKNNDHQKIFTDTGCKLFFYTPEAARGRSITYLIIDEAAFIKNMREFWNDIFPTVNTGGNVIVVSTVNGVGNWYHATYTAAQQDDNDFNVIDIEYTEHPEYDDPDWVSLVRAQLGEKGFQQEILRSFHGAGDSFIPTNIVNDLLLETRDTEPVRELFNEWANKLGRKKNDSVLEDGALLVWREPIEGRDYVMGVDAASGMGEECDNSCFQIYDASTLEQVAEFYSNEIKPYVFAQICAHTANMYNNALIVVENEKDGQTVLSHLQHDVYYENLFRPDGQTPGVKMTTKSRPMMLAAIQTRLMTGTMSVHSRRLAHEIEHFIYNITTKKPEAASGYHDDAIIATCLALYARDLQMRSSPIGAGSVPEELTERYKAEVYEDIKRELAKGLENSWVNKNEESNEDKHFIPKKRPFDSILKEFGWVLIPLMYIDLCQLL